MERHRTYLYSAAEQDHTAPLRNVTTICTGKRNRQVTTFYIYQSHRLENNFSQREFPKLRQLVTPSIYLENLLNGSKGIWHRGVFSKLWRHVQVFVKI
jgi:hypothetical protein